MITTMNQDKFKKAIRDIKSVGMTAAEKGSMLSRILAAGAGVPAPDKTYSMPIMSPWRFYSFRSWMREHGTVSVSLAIIVIFGLSGGGVALAAEGSLPGDLLYPVKVNITEPVRQVLAPTTLDRAELAVRFAVQRVKEAEALVSSGHLDTAKQAKITGLIDTETKVLNNTLHTVALVNPVAAADIGKDFDKKMREHADKLDGLTRTEDGRAADVKMPSIISTISAAGSAATGTVSRDDATNTTLTTAAVTIIHSSATSSAARIANQARENGDDIGSHDWHGASTGNTPAPIIRGGSNDAGDKNILQVQSRNDTSDAGDQKASVGGYKVPVGNEGGDVSGAVTGDGNRKGDGIRNDRSKFLH